MDFPDRSDIAFVRDGRRRPFRDWMTRFLDDVHLTISLGIIFASPPWSHKIWLVFFPCQGLSPVSMAYLRDYTLGTL